MRRLPSLALALVLLPLSACDAGPTGPDPNTHLHGTYALESVNGQPLPFTLSDDGSTRVERTSGRGVIRSNRSCEWNYGVRSTDKRTGKVEETVERNPCSYVVKGNTIILRRDAGGGEIRATVAADSSLVSVHEGLTQVWRK